MKRANKIADITSPCGTPILDVNGSENFKPNFINDFI